MIRVTIASATPLYLNTRRILFVRENEGGRPFMNPPPPGWQFVTEAEKSKVIHRAEITYQDLHPSVPDTFTVCESPEGIAAMMKEAQP